MAHHVAIGVVHTIIIGLLFVASTMRSVTSGALISVVNRRWQQPAKELNPLFAGKGSSRPPEEEGDVAHFQLQCAIEFSKSAKHLTR